MCLSNVYKNKVDDSSLLMKNVQHVELDGKNIILVDLLERKKIVEGILKKVDLIENTIIIQTLGENDGN